MTDTASQTPTDGAGELDQQSMAAIRDILADEEPVKRKGFARREKAAPPPEAPPSKRDRLSPLAPQAQVETAAQAPEKGAKLGRSDILDALKAKVMGYRPTVRHVVLAALALLVFFRPWLMLALVFVFAFLLVGVFLILGYDGFWRRVMGVARWYARRHPSRSAELHRKLDSFAVRFDAFLDRFPEGSVDGLYLPDFGDLAEAEARHDEALDRRFDKMRES